MRYVGHYLRRIIVILLKIMLYPIPKQRNLIMFSSWFGQRYSDNTMYLFEYMLENNPEYEVCWFTRNKDVYRGLSEQGKPVVYANSIRAIVKQIRARMLVSTVQFNDFNRYLLCKCVFYDLDHGFLGKYCGYDIPETTERQIKFEMLLRKWVEYYFSVPGTVSMEIFERAYGIDRNKIVFANKPRIDVILNKELMADKNPEIRPIVAGRKMILYMPTHRECGAVQMDMNKLLNLEVIQSICQKNNAVFLIRKHFYHKDEVTDLKEFDRIYDITSLERIDTQSLIACTDVMVTDYSSCQVDYLPSNKPIIYYMYDLENYVNNERGYYFSLLDTKAGFIAQTKDEFSKDLDIVSSDWKDEEHQEGRKELLNRWFDPDVDMGNSREMNVQIISQLINGSYRPKWYREKGR